MQSVSSRIWTRVAVSISYDDNHYTTGTSIIRLLCDWSFRLYQNIIYIYFFVAYCQFCLIYGSFGWRCFMLLSKEIQSQVSLSQVLPTEISFLCRLLCPYNCFSSHFCFLVIFALMMLVLSMLFLVAVISFFCTFLCSHWGLASPLPPSFLDAYCLSTSSLQYKTLCIFMRFPILLSIYRSSPLVHFKNGPEYLTKGVYPFDEISTI